MEPEVRQQFENLSAKDNRVRFDAFEFLLQITECEVPWADEVWDELLQMLEDTNSYQRSIGIMLLCNLAKSDVSGRVSDTLPLVLAHTRDDKFMTSRQCLQSIWKIAAADDSCKGTVIKHLEERFVDCENEEHPNLLRRDVTQSLKALYDESHDAAIWHRAHDLVEREPPGKFRKQYEKTLGSL